MKTKLNKKTKTIISVFALLLPTVQAAHAQCDVGPVLFKDTLFGAAIGAGVGALVQVANQSTDRIAANIATATLIGAGIGVVVGVVELSLSDCGSRRNAYAATKPGFEARPLLTFAPTQNFENPTVTSLNSSPKFSFDNFNQMGMGLSLSYTFSN